MIKSVAIKQGCIGCGTCERICPSVFQLQGGQSTVKSQVFTGYEQLVLEAMKRCPVKVIAVETEAGAVEEVYAVGLLREMKDIARNTFRIFIALDAFEFLPGQYVTIKMHDSDGDFTKCYSIVSYRDGLLELCIRFSEKSRSFQWFKSQKISAKIPVSEASGDFVLHENENPKILVATGTGIAPMFAFLDRLKEVGKISLAKVIFGLRDQEDMFYEDRLKSYPEAELIFTLSQPKEGWEGKTGRVTEHLNAMSFSPGTEVYICGNPNMVAEVKELFVQKGLSLTRIHYEEFIKAVPHISKKAPWFERIIFEGHIPYSEWISRIIYGLALVTIMMVPFFRQNYRDFGNVGWYMLTAVMLIRPLADVFPQFGILRSLMSFRREFGIWTAVLLLCHMMTFLMLSKIPLPSLFTDKSFWGFNNFLTWGTVGVLFSLPVLITSNDFSMRLLKRNWKKLQRLAYLFFIFGGIHIYLISKDSGVLLQILFVAIFWIISALHVRFMVPSNWLQKVGVKTSS